MSEDFVRKLIEKNLQSATDETDSAMCDVINGIRHAEKMWQPSYVDYEALKAELLKIELAASRARLRLSTIEHWEEALDHANAQF